MVDPVARVCRNQLVPLALHAPRSVTSEVTMWTVLTTAGTLKNECAAKDVQSMGAGYARKSGKRELSVDGWKKVKVAGAVA